MTNVSGISHYSSMERREEAMDTQDSVRLIRSPDITSLNPRRLNEFAPGRGSGIGRGIGRGRGLTFDCDTASKTHVLPKGWGYDDKFEDTETVIEHVNAVSNHNMNKDKRQKSLICLGFREGLNKTRLIKIPHNTRMILILIVCLEP